jgi:hypothetical protein
VPANENRTRVSSASNVGVKTDLDAKNQNVGKLDAKTGGGKKVEEFEVPKKFAKAAWMEKSSNAPVAKSNLWDPLRDTNETVLMITAQKQKKYSGSESSYYLKDGYKIDLENCE